MVLHRYCVSMIISNKQNEPNNCLNKLYFERHCSDDQVYLLYSCCRYHYVSVDPFLALIRCNLRVIYFLMNYIWRIDRLKRYDNHKNSTKIRCERLNNAGHIVHFSYWSPIYFLIELLLFFPTLKVQFRLYDTWHNWIKYSSSEIQQCHERLCDL